MGRERRKGEMEGVGRKAEEREREKRGGQEGRRGMRESKEGKKEVWRSGVSIGKKGEAGSREA